MTVLELLRELAPMINDQEGRPFPILNAVNSVLRALYRELLDRKSDLVCGDLSINFVAGQPAGSVPASDFAGLRGKPWVDGKTVTIDPISGNGGRAEYDGKTGTNPHCYDLQGDVVVLYPTPSVDLTLKGRYYKKFVDLAAVSDVIPLPQFIDTVKAGVMLLNRHGLLYCVTSEFRAMIEEDVARQLRRRDDHARRAVGSFF